MKSIQAQASDAEQNAVLAPGADERFSGYGVMGVPFSSGHVLAMRRFPITSVGPGYTSVWLRRPSGGWTMYADVPPSVSCARYFGAGLEAAVQCPIRITWMGDSALTVRIGGDVDLTWDLEMEATPVTRAMTAALTRLPGQVLANPSVLKAMGAISGPVLRAGHVGLAGKVPNGQGFRAQPRSMWFVFRSSATLAGEDLGNPQPLQEQARLGGFWIPQRGIFVIGASSFDAFDPARHFPADGDGSV